MIEALKYHLLKGEQKTLFKTPRTKPRQPVGLPKVLIVVGGQAPKAIRTVECYDFKEEKWYQVNMPSIRTIFFFFYIFLNTVKCIVIF